MQRIVFIIIFCIFCPLTSKAELIYTSDAAQADGVYFSGYYPFLDRNSNGFARRFMVTGEEYVINSFEVGMSGDPDRFFSNWGYVPGKARALIYAGTVCTGGDDCLRLKPLHGVVYNLEPIGELYKSTIYSIPRMSTLNNYGESNLSITLVPGDYWFAVEGGEGVSIGGYSFNNNDNDVINAIPEPNTFLLLFFALGILLFLRCMNKKLEAHYLN